MTAAFIFLENNGYKSIAKEGEISKFALTIIEKKLSVEKIAQWLETHAT